MVGWISIQAGSVGIDVAQGCSGNLRNSGFRGLQPASICSVPAGPPNDKGLRPIHGRERCRQNLESRGRLFAKSLTQVNNFLQTLAGLALIGDKIIVPGSTCPPRKPV